MCGRRNLSYLDAIHDFFYPIHFCFLPLKHLASLPDDFHGFVSEQITPALWRQWYVILITSVRYDSVWREERGDEAVKWRKKVLGSKKAERVNTEISNYSQL
jgi:hypothetical protein